jgi:glycosyltransferase involved in cell wall biosynthesis
MLSVLWSRGRGPRVAGDVVHAPTLLLPPARRGQPLVVTIHDAVPWTHPETLTPHGASWHRRMAALAVRDAAAIVVPTHAVADGLRSHVQHLDATRLHVIAQGATGALSAARPDALTRLGLPPRYLLSLATLEPRKGLDVLLEALSLADAPRLPLVVVGQPGWGGVDVAQSAERLGLGGRVRLLGRIPDEELAAVLAGATALVMPSRAEGFGLPVLEAMAAGTPAVTSDDPALLEVGGDATRSAPRGDAPALARVLAQVTGDDRLLAEMADSGRRRAASFDWDQCARRLWDLYRSLG